MARPVPVASRASTNATAAHDPPELTSDALDWGSQAWPRSVRAPSISATTSTSTAPAAATRPPTLRATDSLITLLGKGAPGYAVRRGPSTGSVLVGTGS